MLDKGGESVVAAGLGEGQSQGKVLYVEII